MSEIRHMPPAPDKELPFLVLNMFHFPTDEAVREYEANVRKWWPELHFFIGRVSGDVSAQYTHAIVWMYQDFDDLRRNLDDYATTLADSSKPEGDWPGYTFDKVYMCRITDDRDPILLEHGIEEWNRRLLEVSQGSSQAAGDGDVDDAERARRARVTEKLAESWGDEALKQSGWE